ncbi:MAG: metallophosphoesterase [Tannerellaceae bacterium]|nr:metallophosphoesterase [Tannerellaceae bacterium]MCD8263752.1 metallophosphoesterase [Tannerellaceae bacterium]
MWVTNGEAFSWVEVAPDDGSHFYGEERPKYYQAEFGRKAVGRLHRITVKGLQPGIRYRYRIFSKEVMELTPYYVQYGKVASSTVYRVQPYSFTTLDKSKQELSFRVINDIHGDSELLATLAGDTKATGMDFIFFNGDMVSTMDSEEQLFTGFMNQAVADFATDIPLFLSRGNHEARGNFSSQFMNYFPTSTGTPYYMFTAGPVCCLVLDAGEDKPDSDIEYWGLADLDAYREEQAVFIKEAMEQPAYRNATFRIVIMHVPPLAGPTPWHGSRHLQEHFVPLLNQANVDVMLCAHTHRHMYYPAGTDICNFPILINANRDVMDVKASDNQLDIQIRDEKQKLVGNWSFKKK